MGRPNKREVETPGAWPPRVRGAARSRAIGIALPLPLLAWFLVEPTITFTNVFGSPPTMAEGGIVTRDRREADFEVILSLGLPTRVPWLEFTAL